MKSIFNKIILTLLFSIVFGQQGVYKKKSVSSLDAVWIKPGATKNTDVNVKILNDFMKFYIEVPRFDFNQLSKSQVRSFIEKANSLDEVNSEKLSEVMESTIIKDIIDILNDPEVQKMRSENFKDESDFESFAATKAKSLSLTAEQLGQLMNSAYIYLPYITSIVTKQEENDLEIDMSGGIIWWKVNISSDGSVSVDEVLNAETSSSNVIDLKAKNILTGETETYDEYSFGDNSYKTTPQSYIQGGAMLAFAKNLNVKTRELSDFKLQAQVMEKSNSFYSFKLGLSEGLHLDDGLFLVEYSEDNAGNEKTDNIGFLRVTKSADNKNDPVALSRANQLFGDAGDVGSVVMEHPRLGIDTRIRFGMKSGLNVEPAHAFNFIKETAESAFMVDMDFSYNLAPIINMSQTFLDFGFSLGVPVAEYSDLAIENGVGTIMWDIGMGLSKKVWFGRMNIPFGISYNYQALSLVLAETEESLSFAGPAAQLSTGFEYMINANTIFHIGIDYSIAAPLTKIILLDSEGNETDYSEGSNYYGEKYIDHWNEDGGSVFGETNKKINLGGLSIRLGIDYSLGQLGFDLFGFLDPLKKY